ncbi:MAG: DUF2306 domain-containing protein [Vicinamibacterales bacterium]
MTLEPLVRAPLAVQIHVATVLPAFVLGTWLLFGSAKGSPRHRTVGAIYLGLMTATAVAATFIRSFMGLSLEVGPLRLGLIHLFVPLTFNGVYGALASIRHGRIRSHEAALRGLYFGGLIIAGLLAFAPGRVMYRMFFG